MPQHIPAAIPDISDTVRTNYVGFASFAVLIWDHIDTFSDEVDLIWRGKRKGLFIYLFLFNRYFTPLGFVVNLYAYLSPTWTFERCQCTLLSDAFKLTHFRCARFVRYEGCTVVIAVEVVGLMMLLRINALYPHQKWITKSLGALLIFETAFNSDLACSMVFDPSISGAASASAWVPLLYDTIIFGLTLYRTVPPIRREEASYIIKRLLEDGLLYYSVIFSVTFVLTFMIVAAPPGTKNIVAQMEQLITVAMMSRITLNLKKAGEEMVSEGPSSPKSLLFDRERRPRGSFQYWDNPVFTASLPPIFPSPARIHPICGGNEVAFTGPSPSAPPDEDDKISSDANGQAHPLRKPVPALLKGITRTD
ncbi:hypothetical protein GALMADRAFT_161557 [Galerina marginata CBS 339.88]|uniref:DUF6533 domain-containing protein n=1 Tax=Galerina marginata (strain CBS 339.88) TaxID=685588 RepID=A0A067S9J9_GALM3|nr:hypothetical protein GALMADRAFT_161557 [Galerina marginata CBS 339.88]